jgi:prefoldin subunit 5
LIFSKILAEAISILEDRIKTLDDERKGIPFWRAELEKKKKELQSF